MAATTDDRSESTRNGLTLEDEPHHSSVRAIVGLRLVMGWLFVSAAYGKLAGEFSARGFLANVDPASPASGVYGAMAADPTTMAVVDVVVPATELLIGAALLAGAFVRLAALGGAVQMALFYAGSWDVAGGVVNDQVVYAAVLLALGALAAGRVLGADRALESHPVVDRRPSLRYLLG